MSAKAIEHYDIQWRGMSVRATYHRDAFGGPAEIYHCAHLEVTSAVPSEPLPISETGYKSQFLPAGEIENAGGVVAYVTRWLDTASRKPAWKAIERERLQGCLF